MPAAPARTTPRGCSGGRGLCPPPGSAESLGTRRTERPGHRWAREGGGGVGGNGAARPGGGGRQGSGRGLADGAALVGRVLGRGYKPGLVHYARSRQADQEATVRYTDTLARAFTNPSSPARVLGGLGLAAHAGWPGLRRRLVQAAMGFRPPISRLARPLDAGDRKP